jgi:hypothetical protein
MPEAPVDTLVVEAAATIADVMVAVDATEYDPYADDDMDVANADEDTDEL